jgi:hypothetical protein
LNREKEAPQLGNFPLDKKGKSPIFFVPICLSEFLIDQPVNFLDVETNETDKEFPVKGSPSCMANIAK